MKIKSLYILLLLIIIFIPFSIYDSSDDIEAVTLDDTSIGYYQSTTCKISLLEFLIQNNNDLELYYNNNDYADINCFGKITGVGTKQYISLLLKRGTTSTNKYGKNQGGDGVHKPEGRRKKGLHFIECLNKSNISFDRVTNQYNTKVWVFKNITKEKIKDFQKYWK